MKSLMNISGTGPHLYFTTSDLEKILEKLAQIFRLDKQNAYMYNMLSSENRALKKQLEDYHTQPNTLERREKIGER
ncbi:16544_t:CDS:2, partial [Funneliformis geosporum]